MFLFRLLAVISVNLVLSADNGIVIALAVNSIPRPLRTRAILGGIACAVVVQVAATYFAGQLMGFRFLRLAGGIAIVWVAVRLFRVATRAEGQTNQPVGLIRTVALIMLSNLTMSVDNILAVAGLGEGDFPVLLFGLALSISFIAFAGTLLARLMDAYPVFVYAGAAILGNVGAGMVVTDPILVSTFSPTVQVSRSIQAATAIGVLAAGRFWRARHS